MPIVSSHPNLFKSFCTRMMFIEPAENDYLFARFAKLHGINSELWWKAAQTIEKSLKAIILLNGGSSKPYGHDLSRMFTEQQRLLGRRALDQLEKPEVLNEQFWRNENVENFIARVGSIGNPDSRYALQPVYGYCGDIFKFDELYFQLKRRCYCMEWIIGENGFAVSDQFQPFIGKSFGQVVLDNPRMISKGKLFDGKGIASGINETSDIIRRWNVSFEESGSEYLKGNAPVSIVGIFPGFSNTVLNLIVSDG